MSDPQDELVGDLRAEIATLHDELRATRKALEELADRTARIFKLQSSVTDRIFDTLDAIIDQLEPPDEDE